LWHYVSPLKGGNSITAFFIVDDETMLLMLYKEILETKGYKVIDQALNGEECISKLIERKNKRELFPDVVILDYRMPSKNGLDTMKELLKLDPKLKIICVSADDSVKEIFIASGAAGFIGKPFYISDFHATLEKILNK
jgi:two-component system chemotaxis response regulator CheY